MPTKTPRHLRCGRIFRDSGIHGTLIILHLRVVDSVVMPDVMPTCQLPTHAFCSDRLLRLGRTSFAKCITSSDPTILQSFKQLCTLRPVNVVTKNNTEAAALGHAAIIRRRRTTFASLIKDHADAIQNAMNEFKKDLPNQSDSRAACLCCGYLNMSIYSLP